MMIEEVTVTLRKSDFNNICATMNKFKDCVGSVKNMSEYFDLDPKDHLKSLVDGCTKKIIDLIQPNMKPDVVDLVCPYRQVHSVLTSIADENYHPKLVPDAIIYVVCDTMPGEMYGTFVKFNPEGFVFARRGRSQDHHMDKESES